METREKNNSSKKINLQGIELWNIKNTRTKNVHKNHAH